MSRNPYKKRLASSSTNYGTEPVKKRPLERDVSRACDELAALTGWSVERYEQTRATRIQPGLPDRRYVHPARRLRVWVELKRPGGRLTLEQARWIWSEIEAGGLATALDSLESMRLLLDTLRGADGHAKAQALCRDLTAHISARGWRTVAKTRTLRP